MKDECEHGVPSWLEYCPKCINDQSESNSASLTGYSDTELINFLELENKKARYTGKCKFRLSSTGRGWRLHETSGKGACGSVREAIYDAIRRAE